jgi:ADP-ribose pyrophosphatase YjhB (NUDIX family)
MEMKACRRCGAPLTPTEPGAFQCSNQHIIYANSSPTVGIFFVTEDSQVLLAVRGIEPHKGMLDSFGGFLDGTETFEAAAARELTEELMLTPADYEPLRYLTSGAGHYPFKGEVLPVITVFFWTRLTTTAELTPRDDVACIKSLPLHDLDLTLLHDQDIQLGIQALQRLFPN